MLAGTALCSKGKQKIFINIFALHWSCYRHCDCCYLLCIVGYSIDLSPEDPQWVGAWWIGFLLSGSLSFLIAIPLSAFPKSIPGNLYTRTAFCRCNYRPTLKVEVKVGFLYSAAYAMNRSARFTLSQVTVGTLARANGAAAQTAAI